jgi:hypothetical protein
MSIIDYNGTGPWTKEAIQERYSRYARSLRIAFPQDLSPDESTQGRKRWVYPVMDKVIEGIEQGDRACIEIGLEFIEEDGKFVFGKTLKSNTARALRRATLDTDQEERVRKRLVAMLLAGQVPHEYHEYAKLMRKVGLGKWWPTIEKQVNRSNPYVMRYYRYFERHVLPAEQHTV